MTTTTTTERPSRPRDADATRQALLHAAMRRFTLLGYDRTTTRDIAADAGVNVSLIARYFGSKDGLFAAVLQESEEAMGEERPDQTAGDLVTELVDGLDARNWAQFGGEHPLLMILRDAGDSEEVARLRRRGLEAAVDRLARLAADEGRVPTGRGRTAETRVQGELLLAAVVGLLTVRGALPDGALATASPTRLRDALAALVDAAAPPRG